MRQPAHMVKHHIGVIQLFAEDCIQHALGSALRALIQMVGVHPRHARSSLRDE